MPCGLPSNPAAESIFQPDGFGQKRRKTRKIMSLDRLQTENRTSLFLKAA